MTDLLNHIKALNAETQAWVDAVPGRGAGFLTEDLAHWSEYGITTPMEFDMYMLKCTIVDIHKSVYGFKPSWIGLGEMSMEELQKELEGLTSTCVEEEDYYASYYETPEYKQWEKDAQAQEEWNNIEGELVFTDGYWH